MERVLHFDVEQIGEFIGEPTARRLLDETFDGGEEGAEAGKPDGVVGPETGAVEAGDVGESVEASAMGVAGEVAKWLELAEDGDGGGCTESFLELGESGGFMAQKVLAEGVGIEGERAHNDRVPTACELLPEL
jgi:hypothetical protein